MTAEQNQKQTQNIIKTLSNLGHPIPSDWSMENLERELEAALANAQPGVSSGSGQSTPPMLTRVPLPDELSDPTLGGTRHVPPMMAS